MTYSEEDLEQEVSNQELSGGGRGRKRISRGRKVQKSRSPSKKPRSPSKKPRSPSKKPRSPSKKPRSPSKKPKKLLSNDMKVKILKDALKKGKRKDGGTDLGIFLSALTLLGTQMAFDNRKPYHSLYNKLFKKSTSMSGGSDSKNLFEEKFDQHMMEENLLEGGKPKVTKKAPKSPKKAPKSPKKAPKSPKKAPKSPKKAPKSPKKAPKSPKKAPK
jgi:hypothetical protein